MFWLIRRSTTCNTSMHRIKNRFFMRPRQQNSIPATPASVYSLSPPTERVWDTSVFFNALRHPPRMHVNTSSEGWSLASLLAASELRCWQIVRREMVGGEVRTYLSSETIRSRVRERGGQLLAAWAKSSVAPLSVAYRWQQLEVRWVATETDQEEAVGWTLSEFCFTFSEFRLWKGNLSEQR